MAAKALLGIDVGGTFTDGVLVYRNRLYTAKVLTTGEAGERGVMEAINQLLCQAGLSGKEVGRFAHGMTVTTNALLEERGAKAALIATMGFTDLVELGRQARPSLYELCTHPPKPLIGPRLRFGVRERSGPDGPQLAPEAEELARLAKAVAASGAKSVAVVLLHSYAHPRHELLVARALRKRLGAELLLSLSHQVVGTFREYERGATTELNAVLAPLLARYLYRLERAARRRGLPQPQVISSAGGLLSPRAAGRHAAQTVLSGPAGGVAGAALVGQRLGEQNLLCLDMGGTSCDIAVVEGGRWRESAGRTVGGRVVALPMLDITTIGAGGGSIAWVDRGGALRVGPRSAGALPGPACYGRGGREPTVTDANLLLGRLSPTLPLGGTINLDREAARAAFKRLAHRLDLSLEECAEGVVAVAEAEMGRALRVATVERGIDPRRFTLVAFGGAAGLHACALAEQLDLKRVVCPAQAGVLSALGLVAVAPRRDGARTVLSSGRRLTAAALERTRTALLRRLERELGEPPARTVTTYEMRFAGQSFELPVRIGEQVDPARLIGAFRRLHRRRYGFLLSRPVEVVTVRVTVFGKRSALPALPTQAALPTPPRPHQLRYAGKSQNGRLLVGPQPVGTTVLGPLLYALPSSTVFVPPGWAGEVVEGGAVRLERQARRRGRRNPRRAAPIEVSLTLGRLHAACEEMGATLIRAAASANIKERRDASTALFNRRGELIMQAEHIPVHLGAMPSAVEAVRALPQRPDRVWILNDPYRGGTHLPDITLIAPAFVAGRLVGFAAARAHHADVGGRWPGSMPADSTTLSDEGVVIPPTPLSGRTVKRLVAQMRQPEERSADLAAQLASVRLGARRLAELAGGVGTRTLERQSDALLDYAQRRMEAALRALQKRVGPTVRGREFLEAPEGDLELRVEGRLAGGRLRLDFRGSAPQHSGNLNCPLPVTLAACYFALRVVADPQLPPCAGAYRPLEVVVPPGSLLNATPPAAVAAGNVETSSRVADLLLRAFGWAQGQGTMNNLTLGNNRFTYYETVGGGQGACADGDGPSAVHVAMSNTFNTPVEALERDYPLRVRRYERRRRSGGAGRYRGGDGVVRELEAREGMSFSLIAERRRHRPTGAAGGGKGKAGRDYLVRRDGRKEIISAKCTGWLEAGEGIAVETPGGGGYGRRR